MRPLFRPRTDIYETKDSVFVVAEMPGVGPDDVEVTLERGVLIIRGRTPEIAHNSYQQVYAEYGEGDYERVFTISEAIDRDSIKAMQKDGLLTLELPKAAPAKARTIKVASA
jgi:HSP20 family molecular chaperone IbpA